MVDRQVLEEAVLKWHLTLKGRLDFYTEKTGEKPSSQSILHKGMESTVG